MQKVFLLNKQQKELVDGTEIGFRQILGVILDENDNYVLPYETVMDLKEEDLQWLKELPIIDYAPRPFEL